MTDSRHTPADLGVAGRSLWQEVAGTFDLEIHESALLLEACRVKDRLDALDAVVRAAGVTIDSPQGIKAHPAIVEARQQQLVLSRLIASLRLPDENDSRPQRRGGGRGAYLARRPYGTRTA